IKAADRIVGALAGNAERITTEIKEGRVLASRHADKLREAHTALGDVLAATESSSSDDGKAAPTGATQQDAGRPATDPPADADPASASERKSGTAQAIMRLQLAESI